MLPRGVWSPMCGGLKCLFGSDCTAPRLPPNYSVVREPRTDLRSGSGLNWMQCHETHQRRILPTCLSRLINPNPLCLSALPSSVHVFLPPPRPLCLHPLSSLLFVYFISELSPLLSRLSVLHLCFFCIQSEEIFSFQRDII